MIFSDFKTVIPGNALLLVVLTGFLACAHASEWKPLKDDGLHDPVNPGLQWLQNPADALRRMPSDSVGNKVNWVRALDDGYIRPRSSIKGEEEVRMCETCFQ